MKDRGLVYIGSERINFTYGRYYPLRTESFKYIIKDNCGGTKYYCYKNLWCKENFIIMERKAYLLWSRVVKLRKLYEV